MPQLPGAAEPQIKRFVLPTYANLPEDQQAWVDMDISPMSGADMDVYDVEDGDEVATDGKAKVMDLTFRLLANRIKQWNFSDANGTTPITAANVKRLNIKDFAYLNGLITGTKDPNGLTDAAKKDLPSTSQQ